MITFTKLHQTEIQNFHCVTAATIWLEPDIVRLEIAVNDPGAVSFFGGALTSPLVGGLYPRIGVPCGP